MASFAHRCMELLTRAPADFWRPIDQIPGAARLSEEYGWSEEVVEYQLTTFLLWDVVDAVEALRIEVDRLMVLDEMAQRSDQLRRFAKPLSGAREPIPGSVMDLTEATWIRRQYLNILVWGRTLADRISSTWEGRSYGLLSAMESSHPATQRVRRAWEEFSTSSHLPDLRRQAAFGLHRGSLRHMNAGPYLADDGRVLILVPDIVQARAPARELLRFDQGRDAVNASMSLLADAYRLIEEIVSTFEESTRPRF